MAKNTKSFNIHCSYEFIMIFSFIKKKFSTENKVERLNNSVSDAFTNVRKDMAHISNWITHFKGKHDDHEKQFNILHSRLNQLEKKLNGLSSLDDGELEESFEIKDKALPQTPQWDSLTETQQKLCWLIARLQSEMPNQWISLKYLAQETYPEKDYGKVRSTLSSYINVLEELGFIERKRNGKQTYVYSTARSPCQSGKIKKRVRVKDEKTK